MTNKWNEITLFNGRKVRCKNLMGESYNVSKLVADWYVGPVNFNLFFVDFNGMFVDLIEDTVEPLKRIKTNSNDIEALAFDDDAVASLLDQLVEVVNFSSRPVISDDRKNKYANLLEEIAARLEAYRKEHKYGKPDLTVVPMKGGSYFLDFLDKHKIHKKALAIECKRIPVAADGSFCFGMGVNHSKGFPLNTKAKKLLSMGNLSKIRIVELCIVSGMTTIGFLLYLKQNGIKPSEVEINTIAMSQQGYELIRDFALSEGISLKFVTGALYYRLGNYYLSRRDELLTIEGKSVIGDVRSFLD